MVAWDQSNNYKNDNEAFLFSIDKNKKYSVKTATHAIYCGVGYGPTFGSGHDIHITTNSNTNNGNYCNAPNVYNIPNGFSDLSGQYNFTCNEIEVYSILFA